MQPCNCCTKLHGKPADTPPHSRFVSHKSFSGGFLPFDVHSVFCVEWECGDCGHLMKRHSGGSGSINRWSFAEFEMSPDFETNGCHFGVDAWQEGVGVFRGCVHAFGIDNTPIDPPVFIMAPTTKTTIHEALEEAEKFGFNLAMGGRMRIRVTGDRN